MTRLDLSGKWTLCNVLNKKEIKNIPMNIPGDVHSALIREKIISDPYYGFNEKDVQWVGRENWSITRTFSYKKIPGATSFITLDSADTFFTITINGKKCGAGDNYFRSWRFDITKILRDGENSITIEFDSSEKFAVERAKKLEYVVPCTQYPIYSPNRNLVRKIQCQSGWDWGPCLMTMGIYGGIAIETVHNGYLESVTVNTKPVNGKAAEEVVMHEETNAESKLALKKKSASKNNLTVNSTSGKWEATIGIRYFALKDATIHFMVELTGNNTSAVGATMKKVTAGENFFETTIQVENPVLWMSADELAELGQKENALYTLTVTSLAEKNVTNAPAAGHNSLERQMPAEDSLVTKHIGFRTLTLVAKKDRNGCSLYYDLNGRPIFAKGANWVPVDSLPERWTPSRYRYLLQSAVDANMNSLRFWGGGQYENELCYDICDRLGIIIWQDCMFACSLYPSNDEFLESVTKELEDNVYRLQSHPSLALWCGNNENYGALNWYKESRDNRDRYICDYDRLNHDTVERTIKRCDPSRTWWPSSPCAGPGTFGDNWHNDSEGDMHFWSVWHERKSFEAYLSIKPRFVSEFGYESFMSQEGIKEFASDDQLNLTSPVMEFHQRSPSGNSIILENFSRYFRIPESTSGMLYLSQVQQAIAVKTAVSYWRSLRPTCMGATYWQLNDVWPVTSWASIEYSGKWKLLQYAAKKFFSPLAFSLVKKDGELYANVVNETMHDVKVKVTLHLMDFNGGNCIKPIVLNADVPSDKAQCVWTSEIEKLPCQENGKQIIKFCDTTEFNIADYFIYGEMEATGGPSAGGTPFIMNDMQFLSLQKEAAPQKADITSSVTQNDGVYTIVLTTDKPAFYTTLEIPGMHGIFSDNMLTLIPGKPTTVTFTQNDYGWGKAAIVQAKTKADISAEQFKKLLTVTSLRDTYN